MVAQNPQITWPADRPLRCSGNMLKIDHLLGFFRRGQQVVDLRQLEAGQLQVEANVPEIKELQTEQILIPGGLLVTTIVSEPVGANLRRRQVVGNMYGNLFQTELSSSQ